MPGATWLVLCLLLSVELAGMLGVLGRMQVVAMREMRMLRRLLMGQFAMVVGGAAVMLGWCSAPFRDARPIWMRP
jgi:hypothetical protein